MRGFEYRLRAPSGLVTVADYRAAARRRVPGMVWAYLDEGAEDHVSLRRNLAAFRRQALRQQVLRATGEPRLAARIAGVDLELPVLLAPIGVAGLAHSDGELGIARAAECAGTRAVISNASTYSLTEIAAGTESRHWFQLYPWGNERAHMREMLARARDGGFHALFLTVDVPVIGLREGEVRRGMGAPPVLTPRRVAEGALHPRWAWMLMRHGRYSLRNFVGDGGSRAAVESARRQMRFIHPEMGWSDFEWVREQWDGPVFVKGILEAEDAVRAVELGADGVVVSNHGGRQLEGTVGTLDALPEIVDAVGSGAEVLLDGGVRRGGDIVKALALGARAVLVGRPAVYGLAVGGGAGVGAVLRILRDELDRTLTLMGCADVAELDRSWLRAADQAQASEDMHATTGQEAE